MISITVKTKKYKPRVKANDLAVQSFSGKVTLYSITNKMSKSLGVLCLMASVLMMTSFQDSEALMPTSKCPKGSPRCPGNKRFLLNQAEKVTQMFTFI